MKYSLDTKIRDLLENREIVKKLEELFPGLMGTSAVDMVKGNSLKEAAYLAPHILTDEILKKLGEFLENITDEK